MPRLEIWTVNLGRGIGTQRFRQEVERVLDAADPERAVICLQEIDEADPPPEHRVIAARAQAYKKVGWATAVPILVSLDRFKVVATEVTFASRGLPKITPHREVVGAVCSLRSLVAKTYGDLRPGFPKTVFLNVHFPRNLASTRTRRLAARAVLTARVNHHAKQGRVVFYVLDSNTRGVWPRLVRGEKILLEGGPGGIDKIVAVVPRNVTLNVLEHKKVDLHIDAHDALCVVVEMFLRG